MGSGCGTGPYFDGSFILFLILILLIFGNGWGGGWAGGGCYGEK